jgi:hypothetical protein
VNDEGTMDSLFADVCRTLAGAGFDIVSASTRQGTGLRVSPNHDAVTVTWLPEALDPAGRANADYEGIRAALRRALLEVLTQAGYAVQADGAGGEVWVTRA